MELRKEILPKVDLFEHTQELCWLGANVVEVEAITDNMGHWNNKVLHALVRNEIDGVLGQSSVL